jgi:hypothetical protein
MTMGEAKRRKEIDKNYGKRINAIYIDTIFLSRAILNTYNTIAALRHNLNKRDEWEKNDESYKKLNSIDLNSINVSKLVPFLVEYASIKNEITGWMGFEDDKDIDIFVFSCPGCGVLSSVYPTVLNLGKRCCNIQLLTEESFVMFAMQSHVVKNQSFKKYESISIVGNEQIYDGIVKQGMLQGVNFMRYKLTGDDDKMVAPISWQRIEFPLGRMWGLEQNLSTWLRQRVERLND